MDQADVKRNENGKSNEANKANYIGRFLAALLVTAVFAAGWFLLWAYVSYELRLSTEVIRAGLVLFYILPCLGGGRLLRRCVPKWAGWYGAALGMLYYAILLAIAAVEGEEIVFAQTDAICGALCVASGIIGTIRFRNKKRTHNQGIHAG